MFAKKTLLLPADNFRRQSSPSRRGQTSRLFEAAGEVALMRETGIGGDLRQLAAARDQAALGFMDLAAQQEMLGCLADQVGEAPMKMEGREMRFAGDVVEGRV